VAKTGATPLLLVGVGLLLVGFAFKLSFVPFHMWTPDVYEGAPTAVTAFMSVGTKAAVFGALLRLVTEALPAVRPGWASVLWALALLTMILGNVAAITQRNVKRMLAYSSIAQAGYILVALVAADRLGISGVLFYVAAYAFMSLGAFAVVVAVSREGDRRVEVSDYAGLGSSNPLLAAAMTLFMLSLAGVPPTAGFLAKLYVFTAAIQAGYADLAVVGALTSAVATFYYLWVVVQMYMRPPSAELKLQPIRVPASLVAMLAVAAFFTLQLGILPSVLTRILTPFL
jgi:NADH-quinone oxidoreductase subunit N